MDEIENGQVFTCDVCKQSCQEKAELILHIQKFHSINSNFLENRRQYGDNVVVYMRHFPFICKICKKKYANRSALHRHMEQNHLFGKFQCDHCKKIFATRTDIRVHVKSHNKVEVKFTCTDCGKIYKDRQSFTYHLKFDHSSERQEVQCAHCLRVLKHEKALRNHVKKCLVLKPKTKVQCDLCGAIVGSDCLNSHYRSKHTTEGLNRVKCKICDRFISELHFQKHIKKHTKVSQTVDCNICQKTYKGVVNLKRHMKLHNDVIEKFKCKFCEAMLSSRAHLARHIRNNHKPNEQVECNFCGKHFKHNDSLKYHMSTKHPKIKMEVPQCTICNKIYPDKYKLNNHMREVHLSKEAKCDICDRVMKSEKLLRAHKRRLHEEREGYNCDICEMAISSKPHLVRHIKYVHNKHRNFNCIKCGRTLKSDADLKRHVNLFHPDSSQIITECQTCSVRFENENSLREHVRKNHSIDGSECPQCGKYLKNRRTLRRHLKCVHSFELSKSHSDKCENVGKSQNHKDMVQKCDLCNLEFNEKESYSEHIKLHEKNRDLTQNPCFMCGSEFQDKIQLKNHIYQAHINDSIFEENLRIVSCSENKQNDENRHKCRFCPKIFCDAEKLNCHLTNKHKQVVVLCDIKEKNLCDKYLFNWETESNDLDEEI